MRHYKLFLQDILESMVAVQEFVNGMDFEAFLADDT